MSIHNNIPNSYVTVSLVSCTEHGSRIKAPLDIIGNKQSGLQTQKKLGTSITNNHERKKKKK